MNRKRTGALLLGMFLLIAPLVFGGGQGEREGKVVAYSAHEDSIIDAMSDLWEETHPDVELEIIRMGSGDVINRVQAESENPQADVIWSIGGEPLEANSDLLADYEPADWDMIDDVYKVGTNWLPYTGIMNVFIVNTEMLDEDEYPRTWPELAADHIDGVSSAAADASGSSYMQLANVLAVYGEEEGWEVYEDILQNFVISQSSGAVPRFVNDGELPVGVTLEDNAQRFVEGGGPVEIVYPEDGAVAAPDGIALIDGAPNPEGGQMFIDWALSDEVQSFLVQEMGRRPVRVDSDTPSGLPPLSEINTVEYDFGWSAENREEFIDRYTDLKMEYGL